MSADNWAICPRCLGRAVAASAERFQDAVDAYGEVPAEEYERLRAKAQVPVDPEAFRTFREDYEFYGAERGTVHADYSGYCNVCELVLSFTHEHPFYKAAP